MGEATFGKYRLIAELGHGGMADVFLAVNAGPAGSGFRKLTVIKRLRANLADEPEFVAMLVDEARIAARLNHPNVVQTNEVGDVDSVYYIAMEYLDGQPLHRVQHRTNQRTKDGGTGALTREQQYIILMDALAGLHHAHELADFDGTPLQIVHRDVTPHNIFVTYTGQVKVVDFGIAKAIGRSAETRAGVVKGKVRYMSPEQALGKKVDRRADIFSLGVILWEVAVGRRLWKDVEDLEVVRTLVSGDIPASPRAVNPDVPEALDAIIQKSLQREPDDRYATAEDFRLDLEQFLSDAGQLLPARRALGPAVSTLFADKRDEIKRIIEQQLQSLEATASGEFRAVSLSPDSISMPSQNAPSSPRPRRDPLSITGAVSQRPSVSPMSSSRPIGGSMSSGRLPTPGQAVPPAHAPNVEAIHVQMQSSGQTAGEHPWLSKLRGLDTVSTVIAAVATILAIFFTTMLVAQTCSAPSSTDAPTDLDRSRDHGSESAQPGAAAADQRGPSASRSLLENGGIKR